MKWFAVQLSLAAHPKFVTLPMEVRGAWITLMLYAPVQPTPWVFATRQHAVRILNVITSDGDHLVQTLIDVGLLDALPDGRLEIHDHEQWQLYPSDLPDQTAERQRRSRANRRSGYEAVTNVTSTAQESTAQETTPQDTTVEDPNQDKTTTEETSQGPEGPFRGDR